MHVKYKDTNRLKIKQWKRFIMLILVKRKFEWLYYYIEVDFMDS